MEIELNPDPFKQAHEVLFSRKIKSQNHPCLHFNNNPVNQTPLQKHIEMYLDFKCIRLFRTLKKHPDQSEQINCFIAETPNNSPKTNITNDLLSFY